MLYYYISARTLLDPNCDLYTLANPPQVSNDVYMAILQLYSFDDVFCSKDVPRKGDEGDDGRTIIVLVNLGRVP